MQRGRTAIFALVAIGLAIAAFASTASGRVAYVTGTVFGKEGAYRVDLATQTTAAGIDFLSGEGTAPAVAITPDGTRAYVTSRAKSGVVPIDVATNAPGTSIPTGPEPLGIAITPDGTRAYVADGLGEVTPIELPSNKLLPAIPVGGNLGAIAITPDGTRAYVADRFGETVTPIALASGTPGKAIVVGESPSAIAIAPDGTRAYVTNSTSDDISVIDLATDAVIATIPLSGGFSPQAIAISPDGTRAYVLGFDSPVTPILLATNTVGTPIEIEDHFLGGVAFLPNGSRAYVTDQNQVNGDRLVPIDVPADTLATAFPAGETPEAIAIVPNQGPSAGFSHSPQSSPPGATVSFNAGASSDSDGSVVRYDWDFGDGSTAVNGGPSPTHTYKAPGNYTVTLTVTDNEGCSTTVVFTGQTAYCNGSSKARTTQTVTVGNCPRLKGKATSFVPKLRSAHVVPGVRVRLAVSAPARLSVTSTLIWSVDGGSGSVPLRKVKANVNRWRRIRLAIPASLREKLPYGTPVTLKLRISVQPRNGSTCAGGVTKRPLKLHIVKVIPDATQAK
jgi:YVTN family beta-propeller protein